MNDNNKKNASIAPVIKLWEVEFSEHISQYTPYQISPQLKQMAALFTPGLFYYYVMNFHNFNLDYVHPGTQDVLGIAPEDITMKQMLSMLPPEELKMLEKKEILVADFLFRFLKPEQLLYYKVVYFFRILDNSGKSHLILHQTTTLTVSETDKVEHVLGIHTDISHMNMIKNDKVSFISLNGEQSYYNLDPEKGVFDPEDSNSMSEFSILFSKRELEIIKLFSEGLTANEVAKRLYISENTVRTHRRNILRKSDCSNITELVATCLVHGAI